MEHSLKNNTKKTVNGLLKVTVVGQVNKGKYIMQIDPRMSLKEIMQEYYNKGFQEGTKAGERAILEKMQPSVIFHGNLSMDSIPHYTNLRLDKKAAVAYEYDKEKFTHVMSVSSFQRDAYNKRFAIYSTSDITREDMPDFLKESLRTAIEKDYYANGRHNDKDYYMKGIF